MEPIVLGISKTNQGYTVFKNLDEDMVEQIKNFKTEPGIFNFYDHKNSKIVQKLNDTQNLCIDNKQKYFIATNKELEHVSGEDKLAQINKKFSVIDAMKKSLGTLYENYYEYNFVKSKGLGGGHDSFGSVIAKEIGFEFQDYGDDLSVLLKGGWSTGMFCFLNEEGNIENRDYNLDIVRLLNNSKKTKEDMIKKIIDKIPNISYENYSNKWFTKSFVYILEIGEEYNSDKYCFRLRKEKNVSGDSYGSGRGRVKKPKNTTQVGREHILQQILPLLNEVDYGGKVDLSQYISLENSKEKKQDKSQPVKRVQKTKIKEKEYEVFDFTKEKFDDEIMGALLNISNSINIPDNATIVSEFIEGYLKQCDLPSYSFDKGQEQEDHDDYVGYVKMPHDCNFTFKVCEGDAVEISWAHSIYETDVIELELVD